MTSCLILVLSALPTSALATEYFLAEGDFKACIIGVSAACCNPLIFPRQLCPGGSECRACGGSTSCECPAPLPPSKALLSDTKRLMFVNGCGSQPLWISHTVANGIGPDPQGVKLVPGESRAFITSVGGGGLSATRFWPKMGCDENGNNCSIGASGGPGEDCVVHNPWGDDYSRCSPPVDSKFEATFMAPGSPDKDTVDMSLVDGYSLPFKLESAGGTCIRNGVDDDGLVDCSALNFEVCPTAETLNGESFDLRAVNPKTGKLGGCYSPCMRLTDDKWQNGPSVAPDSLTAGPYCCAGGDGNPASCTSGPILQTKYVMGAHSSCQKGYAYAYDDKRATLACTTGTQYTVTFYCPSEDKPNVIMM